ncbi:MAG: hypothetical protein NC344_10120 [Bacteroidales bacterium]|nr:hypothetical protein [Bacteroidales bacterium]MCM1148159.1 hypothetical protein [Bacteroidales bacterium]MCM1207114.1 hypothetical protein [Bacillota bacterium]MCM1510866.1 hypothetical protein [Clostridium sp.]
MGKRKGTNDKYEKFASLIVEGKDAAEAYREVYPHSVKWKAVSVANKAYQLLQRDDIRTILTRMREEAQHKAELSREYAVKSLKPMLAVTQKDFYDERGVLRPLPDWTAEMSACVQEIVYDRQTGKMSGVKLYDRIRATERLSRMLGWDKPTEVNLKESYSEMPDDALDAEIERLRRLNEDS